MANKKVTIMRYCKTHLGWKRLPVVFGGNGKLRPGFALLLSEPTHLPDGHYELRTYEGTRTVYKNVGDDPGDALRSLHRETHLLITRQSAVAAGVQIVETAPKRFHLVTKRDEFIKRHLAKGQNRAAETSTVAINDFIQATKHTYADQITEGSVLTFYAALRKRGNQDRTIYGKHMSVFGWFKWMKLDVKSLADKAPNYTEREVSVFHKEDIRRLLSVCDPYQTVVFETLLKTGLRMQEAMHLEWINVDFRGQMIRVRERLDTDYKNIDVATIKDRAERSVPLPDDLAVLLKEWKKSHPGTHYVLGTRNDTPNWKLLRMLKRIVKNAGMNCGKCKGCRGTNECYRWKIKTFRSTYTTTLLRNGIDVRTVMSYTGHADLATVMKYLSPQGAESMQQKVSSIQWT
jgi:integrase